MAETGPRWCGGGREMFELMLAPLFRAWCLVRALRIDSVSWVASKFLDRWSKSGPVPVVPGLGWALCNMRFVSSQRKWFGSGGDKSALEGKTAQDKPIRLSLKVSTFVYVLDS
ncbi:unnamed protein product [Fusarium venenatum]|uniref:Uncharacterized protein n=1 Tax=Fusarium venenatum TaxID=56646 RepID=A0A2L2SUC5_9HYPO|nr:uncharacterized protein FVRRES_05470 [Fusarium venenatum]CEI61034.1 unnamed protein product [Fusarium venenatum]